jgi:hypothetical protein
VPLPPPASLAVLAPTPPLEAHDSGDTVRMPFEPDDTVRMPRPEKADA